MEQLAEQGQEHSVFNDTPLKGETAEEAYRRRRFWFKLAQIYQGTSKPKQKAS